MLSTSLSWWRAALPHLGDVRSFFHNWIVGLQCASWLLLLTWCVGIINHLNGYALNEFGIYPRHTDALVGVFTWVLLHGNMQHLVMNSTPLLVLGFFVALRGPWLFLKITVLVWVLAGLAVWVLGRPAFHIGASGLVFGYFGFIIAIAMYKRSIPDLVVATGVIFYYGGMIFGVLPGEDFVSWEAHLFGLLAGVFAARLFSTSWVDSGTRRPDRSQGV